MEDFIFQTIELCLILSNVSYARRTHTSSCLRILQSKVMKDGMEILNDVGPNARHIRYFIQLFPVGLKKYEITQIILNNLKYIPWKILIICRHYVKKKFIQIEILIVIQMR
jgi:hypothetical protein